MSEQWYCLNCGPAREVASGGCCNCGERLLEKTPRHVVMLEDCLSGAEADLSAAKQTIEGRDAEKWCSRDAFDSSMDLFRLARIEMDRVEAEFEAATKERDARIAELETEVTALREAARWRLCSEELPKKKDFGDFVELRVAWRQSSGNIATSTATAAGIRLAPLHYLAWQPMPPPYSPTPENKNVEKNVEIS